MNEENGKHEFNFFLDKQLQQKLLEANEELLEKEFSSSLFANSGVQTSNVSAGKCNNNSNNNSVGGAQQNSKLPKYCVHVCGWCPDPGVVYRKSEIDLIPRSRVNLAVTRESLFSRDAKLRPQNINNFVFRHYSDPRKYIEQYRKEHACYDSTNSSATKNEFLETRRFYAYNQYSPLAVGFNTNSYQSNSYVPQPQLDSHGQNTENILKSHQQTPALQYTNRRDQKRQTISANLNTKNQHLFKLSKTPPSKPDIHVNDYTEEYIESLEVNSKQRHSAKERSTAITNGNYHKSAATKINVPSANFTGKPLRTSNSGANPESTLPSHFTGHKGGQVQVNTSRMLDTLSCMANSTGGSADKQASGLPPAVNGAAKSKEELLESLRLVNQRPSKPPSRPLHLTFYQEEKKYHIHKNSEPHSFPLEKKQLHESDENSISDSCTNCHGNENNHLNKEEQDINSSDDDGKTNHPRIVYSGIDTNSNLDVSNDTSCLKEESNRSDLAELKYDGAILSLEKDQHMKFDVFSDWRQLRADYEGVSSSGGKVHVNGGEYRRLSMVKKIEERASLSHRRRIKQLIEQSRLKSHLGKLWMHNKSGKLGKENGRQGSFHELTSGYRDGTDGIDQLGGVGMNCVKKTHRNNDSGASTDTVRGKSYSKTGGDAIVEDHLVSKTADDNDTYGYRAMNFEREKCKSAGSEYSSSSGREVGARSDLIHSRKYGRKKDKRNQGLTVVTNCTMEDGIQGKDITNECRQNFYYNENESTVLSTSGVRDIRNSERLGNINKNNDNDIDVLENEGAGVMFTMAKDTLKSQQNVNSTSPLMVPRSNAVSGYDDHAEYSFNVSKYPSIPFVYGTAIRENPVIKSNALKNRNHSLNASPKQRKLSPLSDPTIQVVAEKMAVKINVTKLRYTKVGDVKRSRSMYL